MDKIRSYLWSSQLILFICIFISSLIIPSVAKNNGGVSNFGDHLSTAIFYSIGFLGSSLFIYLAGREIAKKMPDQRYIYLILAFLSALIFLVYITTFPRKLTFTFSYIHDYLGIALFAYEFFISVWLVKSLPKLKYISLFALEVIGSLVGLLSILKIIHLLFIGQIISGIFFGLVLCLCLPSLVRSNRAKG